MGGFGSFSLAGRGLAAGTALQRPSYTVQELSLIHIFSLEASKGRLRVTLSSPVLIKSLFVETPWQGAQYSDNFFDLLPNRPYTIEITHPAIDKGVGVEVLRLTSLNDILAR